MRHLLMIALLILALLPNSNCQSVDLNLISSAGGVFQSVNESLTFTVGEVVTETFSSNNLLLTQGFLQANNLGTQINMNVANSFTIITYPNPAISSFNIDIIDTKEIDETNYYNLVLIDISGKIISKQIIKQPSTKINISTFYSGTYFIRINSIKTNQQKVIVLQKI